MTIKFENGGDDAPIVTNKSGGKQSIAIGDFTLIPKCFSKQFMNTLAKDLDEPHVGRAYGLLIEFLVENNLDFLIEAIDTLTNEPLTTIAKVLEEGLKKYPRDNWKLIPYEDHINHALCHLYMFLKGDIQDRHLDHAIARIALEYETFIESEDNQ